eukprot:gene23146-28130_t
MIRLGTYSRRQLRDRFTSVVRWKGNLQDPNRLEPTKRPSRGSSRLLNKLFWSKSNIAEPGNLPSRWTMLVPAFMNHLCIGSPYAWSLMADELTRESGIVVSSAQDWTLMEAALPLSLVFVFQGLAAAYFGKWQIKVGVLKSLLGAASCFGGGLLVGSVGIYMHSLLLLYLGYGVLAGTGIGLGYTPPVQALMQWFPDKKGIASGIAIAGFGSGALLFTQCIKELCSYFKEAPRYLGKPEDFLTSTIEGKLYASLNGNLLEVVSVTSQELQRLSMQIPEGLYVVGTGSTGAAEALAVMGGVYLTVMTLSALSIKTPPSSYIPPEPYTVEDKPPEPAVPVQYPIPVQHKVSPVYTVDQAFKSPQFHLLGLSFLCVSTCGMGLFSVAKPMMSEIFSSALPALVTSTFAANYLLGMSAGNLGGRLGWSALSDWLGRKRVFNMITIGSIPIYLCMPSLVFNTIQTGDTLPLYAFCTLGSLAISGMGGVYAMLPAYEADLFGSKYVGAIHGRMLLYSSAASLMGPYMLIYMRSIAENKAIHELMRNFSEEDFLAAFGAPIEQASQLIAAKTLTINKLLAASPTHNMDPSPYLYDNTLYTLAGLMGVAALTHSLVHTPRVKRMAGRSEGECVKGEGGSSAKGVADDVRKSIERIEKHVEIEEIRRQRAAEIARKVIEDVTKKDIGR